MAKSKTPTDPILATLQAAYDALPELKPLTGAKSLFGKNEALANQAIEEGVLQRREIPGTGKGKKAKSVIVGVLTEAGLRRVIEQDSPPKPRWKSCFRCWRSCRCRPRRRTRRRFGPRSNPRPISA